ncbi:glycosyltransferase, partial [Blastocladiella britannica]
MQLLSELQVAIVASGERDYSMVRGDTGPLVYPALHVWIYWLLSLVPSIRVAQYVFAIVYLANLALAMAIYCVAGAPAWTMALLSVSRRVHSIHALRLFNDPFCTLLASAALLAAVKRRMWAATVLLSLATAVKMSALLFLPAHLYILVMYYAPPGRFMLHLALFAAIQVVVAAPFLATSPSAYISGAFELSRTFQHQWTVNWRFIPEALFVSQTWATVTFAAWIGSLLAVLVAWTQGVVRVPLVSAVYRWMMCHPPVPVTGDTSQPEPSRVAALWWLVMLVGIATARSLHYQFYVWYWFGVPYLVIWRIGSTIPLLLRITAIGLIELSWNVFPSRNWSSAMLLGVHVSVIALVLAAELKRPVLRVKSSKPKNE